MDPKTAQILLGAAGSGGAAAATYVDDVFSTHLYTGNDSTQTITNGIDLSGEGGLTWIKNRDAAFNHWLFDTERGAGEYLRSDSANQGGTVSNYLTAFNSNGFTLGSTNQVNGSVGGSGVTFYDYVSWTFRKAPGFFDVVTYTGTGSATTIAHNLGSAPGFLIVKRLDAESTWRCWHRSLPSAANVIHLNETVAYETNSAIWNSTAPTSTHFSVGTNSNVNANGSTYVAYLFAHDEQSFGTGSDEAIIKCGSATADSNGVLNVTGLGFEPQWVLVKNIDDGNQDWLMYDVMRGFNRNTAERLYPNLSNAESQQGYSDHDNMGPTANGFGTDFGSFGANEEHIYVAIRRPHKPPSAGTDVFAIDTANGTSPNPPEFNSGFVTDLGIRRTTDSTARPIIMSRLQGPKLLRSDTAAETTNASIAAWDYMNGLGELTTVDSDTIGYSFRRAPGFMDVVGGTDLPSDSTVTHNLGAQPQLIIAKQRGRDYDWLGAVNIGGNVGNISLNTNDSSYTGSGSWNTYVNSTTFNGGIILKRHNGGITSSSTDTYIVYLFGTLSGISKVGTYSGTGSNVDVDCGFTAGARFVLIKRTDSTGDWYVFDSNRGIVSGNDPYWLFSASATDVTSTDYIDPLNSGFTVTSSAPAALNASGGTYLFLAIA
jgi:hypothetical protein